MLVHVPQVVSPSVLLSEDRRGIALEHTAKHHAVHSVTPTQAIDCVFAPRYDVICGAAPEFVVVLCVPPKQVVVHHATKHIVVRGVTSTTPAVHLLGTSNLSNVESPDRAHVLFVIQKHAAGPYQDQGQVRDQRGQ